MYHQNAWVLCDTFNPAAQVASLAPWQLCQENNAEWYGLSWPVYLTIKSGAKLLELLPQKSRPVSISDDRGFIVRSCKVAKPRDWVLKCSVDISLKLSVCLGDTVAPTHAKFRIIRNCKHRYYDETMQSHHGCVQAYILICDYLLWTCIVAVKC